MALAEPVSMKKSQLRHGAMAAAFALILLLGCGLFRTPMVTAQNQPPAASRQRSEAVTRKVLVRSKSLLVSGAVVEDKLLKRPEFRQLGLVITRDVGDADIVLELRHDLLTKYVFVVIDTNTRTVVAGGKLSSVGGTVADKVAKRFVKEMSAWKRS
ncbi:MAG TPA: hypothetical protein VKD91_23980 [Pyrinomonadaceae bacterium]|nr:hypothetical protein [Pyrinomonadaceae bacterium]